MLGRVLKTSQNYQIWLDTFGSDTVDIRQPPHENADGHMRVLVDAQKLSPMILESLARAIAQKYKRPVASVLEDIKKTGSVAISGTGVEVVQQTAGE